MNPLKNGAVELAFISGNELSNKGGLLNLKNLKQIVGIEFATIDEIHYEIVSEIIQGAIALDKNVAYKLVRK